MTVGVRTNLRALRLIPRVLEVYSLVLISVALRKFELVTIGEQTQGLTTELLLRVSNVVNFLIDSFLEGSSS